jgi:uncharacterized protein YjiS (DUF1127 family)
MNLLQKIKLAWTQCRAFQTALTELGSYSDRELNEFGITRADIPRAAYEEAERHAEALASSRPASIKTCGTEGAVLKRSGETGSPAGARRVWAAPCRSACLR